MGKLSKFFFFCFLLFIAAEILLRGILAFRVGPDVLYYGTSFYKKEAITKTERYKKQLLKTVKTNDSVKRHENKKGKYSKYYPNQIRFDRNEKERFKVRINTKGFRGEDYNIKKSSGVLRIINLGASSTFGYGDKDNETYPYYLEQFMNENKIYKSQKITVEVINLGIPHLTSEEVQNLFIEEAIPLNPDVVTYYGGLSDAHETFRSHARRKIPEGFKHNLKRLLTVEMLLHVYRDKTKYSKNDYNDHVEGKERNFINNLSNINKACKIRNIKFYVITQQVKSYMFNDEDIKNISYEKEIEIVRQKFKEMEINTFERDLLSHSVLMEKVKIWADINHVSIIDGIKALDDHRDLLTSYVHLSPEGNYILAKTIADRILQDFELLPRN